MVVEEVEHALAQGRYLGAGGEVHRLPLLVFRSGNANSGAAIASKELAALLEQPGKLQLGHPGGRPR